MASQVLGWRISTARLTFLAISAGIGLAPFGAAQQRKLSHTLGPDQVVGRLSISPDDTRALYVVYASPPGAVEEELYSVRLDAPEAPVQLSGPLPASGRIRFELSSAARAIYCGPQPSDGALQLYSVPIDGGTPVVLHPPLVSGGNVALPTVIAGANVPSAAITPDETRVVYMADQEVDGRTELYVAPIDGSGPAAKLNHALTGSWSVTGFAIDPGSSAAAYIATEASGTQLRRVYWVPLDGSSSPLQLLAEPPSGKVVRSPLFSPDGQWVLYSVVEFQAGGFTGDIFLVPADASQQAIELSDNLFGSTEGVFAPAEDRIVFEESFPPGLPIDSLYSSTLDGNGTRLDSGQDIERYAIGPDGRTVFYWGRDGIFRVPIDGSAAPTTLVTGPALVQGFSADGARLVYYTTPLPLAPYLGLHSLPLTGGTPTDLYLPAMNEAFRGAAQISPDSRYVMYKLRNPSFQLRDELYAVPIDGSSAPRRIHDALTGFSQRVIEFQLASGSVRSDSFTYQLSGGRVLLRGDIETESSYELFLSYPGPVERAPKSPPPPLQPAGR